jgi:hypothetical protein
MLSFDESVSNEVFFIEIPGEALGSSANTSEDNLLVYILPPLFTLMLVAVVLGTIYVGCSRRKQKKRSGMAMSSGKWWLAN